MEVSGQLYAVVTYPQRKSPCYPLNRRLCMNPRAGQDIIAKRKIPVPTGNQAAH